MSRLRNLLGFMIIALMAAACSAGGAVLPVAVPPAVDELHEANVVSIEARPGNDLTDEEIEIVLNGIFAHPCARISRVNQELDDKVISLDVETARTGKDGCETRLGSIAEFIHIVPIDAEALLPGRYTVVLGELTTGFEIR